MTLICKVQCYNGKNEKRLDDIVHTKKKPIWYVKYNTNIENKKNMIVQNTMP